MAAVLDLIGATLISAFITFMLISVNNNLSVTATQQYMNTNTQQNMVALTEMMQFDFKNIGYRVTDTIKIQKADTSYFSFKLDYDNNGTVDSIIYYLGNTSELAMTDNPDDRPLYRKVNNTTALPGNWGITRMRFKYYDSLGVETTFRSKIRSFKVLIEAMSPSKYDGRWSYSNWEKLYKPRNLR